MVTLPAAVLGNGSLLATVSARGRVQRLWWPHPDRDQLLDELRLGIDVDGTTRWLDDEPFAWEQSYADGTMVLRTTARAPGLEIDVEDLVHPTEPVLLRRISSRDESLRVVVSFAGRDTLAVATSGDVVAVAAGETKAQAQTLAEVLLATTFDEHVEARREHDTVRLATAELPLRQSVAKLRRLYERSLLVFDTLADRRTGAVIAAPELDPDCIHSGGYGFVWARDLAFLVLAGLAAGRSDLVEGALRWLPRAQETSGLWLQRHWTDGSLAPSWNDHQLDETGAVLFAYDAALRELRDDGLDAALWPSTRSAADFLLGAIEPQGIPCETADLWEERDGCHAYTAAAIVGGLRGASSAALRHEPERAETYATAAERLSAAVDRCFWSEEHGRYVRTLGDPTVDVSLLGLSWPFAAVDPHGPRMRATAAAVERALGRPGGGIMRYEGDTYAGGNAWVLAALWLGLYRRQVGDGDGHARSLEYAQRVATQLQLLPEQVTDDGEPAWVVPLAWSHAMLVLAARPELEAIRGHAFRNRFELAAPS